MAEKAKELPEDKTSRERRKHLSDQEIEELELAGGVEGGMQAGSAGGPGASGGRKEKREPKD
jgi:hypothetical protein